MRVAALPAPDTLDVKGDEGGKILDFTRVMSITDQTAGFAAGTLEHMELDTVDEIIINILRKIIAIFEKNGYHSLVAQRSNAPLCGHRTGSARQSLDPVLFGYRIKDNTKSSKIKDCDVNHIRIFDVEL